ncbi:peptidoglycan-binding domain-containing protein [Histidinibacterium aquaticum]|uniref:Peptidoglycan-binding protein n=1 Tax=Histidinibacterium aquaticum TaxID=2613962 RepID=A0A5J5GPK0_9RHOB|nr:hypothetical protein [Histidinibacterium aquaticum]KAA9009362.1 hypothetical protein F3S47_08945 [Histidinibacterium aquaticum]
MTPLRPLALLLAAGLATSAPAAAQDLRSAFYSLPRADRIALQEALGETDLYAATIDGLWGPSTAEAVEAAQDSLAWPGYLRRARDEGETNEIAILLDYARSRRLAASLPTLR